MKRVTFYYVRHGKTEYNRDHIIQGGRVDSPLVADSLGAIENTAKALEGVDLASCYASPLGRAQETARIVLGKRKLPIQTLDNLREFDFGELDGQPYKGTRSAFARCFMRRDFSSVGGETGDEVRERVRRAFKKMYKAAKDGDNVLVVGHGAYLRYVVLEFSQLSGVSKAIVTRTMRAPNASIATIVGEDGKFTLTAMPETADKFVPATL